MKSNHNKVSTSNLNFVQMTLENLTKNSFNNMSSKLNELKTFNKSKKRPIKFNALRLHSNVSSTRKSNNFWRNKRHVNKGETKRFTHSKNKLRQKPSGGGQKVFECLECGKQLTSQGGYKIHLRLHTGEKPFACTLCEKRFSQHNGLKQHLRAHSGERPFVCNKCGKKYSQPGNLYNHLKIHSGEK